MQLSVFRNAFRHGGLERGDKSSLLGQSVKKETPTTRFPPLSTPVHEASTTDTAAVSDQKTTRRRLGNLQAKVEDLASQKRTNERSGRFRKVAGHQYLQSRA